MHSKYVQFWKAINCQIKCVYATDFLVWECMLWRLMLPHIHKYRYFTGSECSNMIRLAKWRNQQTVQNTLWLNNQQIAAIYHFHSAPVPPTWLHKENKQHHYQQEREAAVSDTHDESPSRYITNSHSSRFFRKVYVCCPGLNSRCALELGSNIRLASPQ